MSEHRKQSEIPSPPLTPRGFEFAEQPPTQPSTGHEVSNSGDSVAENYSSARMEADNGEGAHSEFPPPPTENLTDFPSFYPPPQESERVGSVIDAVMKHAEESLEDALRMKTLVEGYREIIHRLFTLAEENKQLILGVEALRRENSKLRRWIKGFVAQNNFLRTKSPCCDKKHEDNEMWESIFNLEEGNVKSTHAHECGPIASTEDKLMEQNMMEKAKAENKALRNEYAELKNEHNELIRELNALRKEVEVYKAPCGCDRRSFGRTKMVPLKGLAKDLYKKALITTREKNNARNAVKEKISGVVHAILLQALRDHNRKNSIRNSRRNLKKINENLRDWVQEITQELVSVKDIGVHQVARILSRAPVSPTKRIDMGEIMELKPARFRELCALLGAKKSTEPYFEELRKVIRDAQKMNIPNIWREKEGEDRADRNLMEFAARRANKYAAAFLGEYHLDQEIGMTNSMKGLQQIVRECMNSVDYLPINEGNHKRLISAIAKIRFMHLAETIKSQIDFKNNDKITDHLKEKMRVYTEYTEGGKPVLTIGPLSEGKLYTGDDRNDPNSIIVESIDVRSSKHEIAIARKHMVKDADGNNNYDPSKIHDFTGLRIELTERDSQIFTYEDAQGRTESPIQHATEKILSLLCAIFGSDLPRSRLRYSYDKGSINEYSTGNHRAFQITFRYRHQCVVNGGNGNGYPKMKSTPVEVQIVVKMDKEERDADHLEYEKKKNRTIQNVLGIDRPFHIWLSDLADVILDEKELVCEAHDFSSFNKLTDREYIAKLLFMALTKRDADGRLVNARTLELLLSDEQEKRKLKIVARKYADHIPLARIHLQSKGMETLNGKVSLNRMALDLIDIIENYKKGTGSTK